MSKKSSSPKSSKFELLKLPKDTLLDIEKYLSNKETSNMSQANKYSNSIFKPSLETRKIKNNRKNMIDEYNSSLSATPGPLALYQREMDPFNQSKLMNVMKDYNKLSPTKKKQYSEKSKKLEKIHNKIKSKISPKLLIKQKSKK